MTGQVVHRERVAWDAAQVIVRALGSRQVVGRLHARLARQFGPGLAVALSDSWNRAWASQRPDALHIERGIWRAKIEDLLAFDGSLAVPLQQVMAETSAELDRVGDVRVPGPVEPPELIIDLDRYRR